MRMLLPGLCHYNTWFPCQIGVWAWRQFEKPKCLCENELHQPMFWICWMSRMKFCAPETFHENSDSDWLFVWEGERPFFTSFFIQLSLHLLNMVLMGNMGIIITLFLQIVEPRFGGENQPGLFLLIGFPTQN